MVEQGFVRPIDGYLSRWPDLDDFFPKALDAARWKGRTYGVPYQSAARTMFYRKDLFLEAGLDPERPPIDWNPFRDAATRLTRVDAQGVTNQLGLLVPSDGSFSFQFWLPFLLQAGGRLLGDDGSPAFNSPEGIEAIEYHLSLYDATIGRGSLGGLPTTLEGGRLAIAYSNPGGPIKLDRDDPLFTGLIGVSPPMRHRDQIAAFYTDWLAVSTTTKHPDETMELVRWLTNRTNLVAYNATFPAVPVRRSSLQSPYVQSSPLMFQVMTKVMPYVNAYPSFNSGNLTVFSQVMEAMVARRLPPEQGLLDFARRFIPIDAVTAP